MSGFAALMGEEGDASDLIELKKKAKKKEEKDKAKAEALRPQHSQQTYSARRRVVHGPKATMTTISSASRYVSILQDSRPCTQLRHSRGSRQQAERRRNLSLSSKLAQLLDRLWTPCWLSSHASLPHAQQPAPRFMRF